MEVIYFIHILKKCISSEWCSTAWCWGHDCSMYIVLHMLLQLFTWDVIDQKIMSDWGWKRNDSDDEIAREIYESVIHVRIAILDYTLLL